MTEKKPTTSLTPGRWGLIPDDGAPLGETPTDGRLHLLLLRRRSLRTPGERRTVIDSETWVTQKFTSIALGSIH